jgi:hypothetical protein
MARKKDDTPAGPSMGRRIAQVCGACMNAHDNIARVQDAHAEILERCQSIEENIKALPDAGAQGSCLIGLAVNISEFIKAQAKTLSTYREDLHKFHYFPNHPDYDKSNISTNESTPRLLRPQRSESKDATKAGRGKHVPRNSDRV